MAARRRGGDRRQEVAAPENRTLLVLLSERQNGGEVSRDGEAPFVPALRKAEGVPPLHGLLLCRIVFRVLFHQSPQICSTRRQKRQALTLVTGVPETQSL